MSAGSLATLFAAGFAVVALGAGMRGQERDALTARRSLSMSALFAAVALLYLLRGLWAPDFSLEFVARHVLRSMPVGARLLSLGAEPGGVALLTSVLVAGGVGLWGRGLPAMALAVGGGTTLVLLTAPLAAGTLRRLPWLPIDGDTMSPLFLEAGIALHLGALALATSCATGAVAGAVAGRPGARALRWALVATTMSVLTLHMATVASGVEASAALTSSAARGGLVAAGIVAMAALATGWHPARVGLEATLAALLAIVGQVLTPAGAGASTPSVVLWGVAGLTALRAAWRARPPSVLAEFGAWRAWREGHRAHTAGVIAVCAVVLATLADVATLRWQPVVGPGDGTAAGRWGTLAQQGVSAYEDSAGTVLAVAVELSRRWRAPALGSATQREVVDVRGRIVNGVARIPARFAGWDARWVVAMDSVTTGERAHLVVQVVPGWWLWWLAWVCLAAAAALPNAPSLRAGGAPGPAAQRSPSGR